MCWSPRCGACERGALVVTGTLSFRLGVILIVGFVLLQLGLVVALQWPGDVRDRPDNGLPPPPALAAMVRALDRADPGEARLLADSYGSALFTIEIDDRAPDRFQEIPAAVAPLAQAYRRALADHNIVVDGGPGRLAQWLRLRDRPMRWVVPIRLTIWLRNGEVAIVTGRPSPGLRAYLLRRSMLAFLGGVGLLALLWFALRQATRPLIRLTRSVEAFGQDLRAPDAPVAGSREMRMLADRFNAMKRRIAGLVEERSFLLAGVAHDLRTYLTRLRLRAEFIEDEAQRERAARDLDQMAALLEDNLLFAGIDHQGAKALHPVELGALARELAAGRPDAERIAIAIDGEPWAAGEETALERIFHNLVDNGLRHGERVTVSAARDGEHVLWRFADDGPGVQPAQLGELGQPYRRLDPSRDRRTGGAGLGLAIVRALAESMGGQARFANGGGGGLEVEVALAADPSIS